MSRSARVLLLAMMLTAFGLIAWSAEAPFSLTLNVTPTVVKPGAKIAVEVVLTNTSNKEIFVSRDAGFQAEMDYKIEVLDRDGKRPPETRYLRAVRGEDTGHPSMVVTGDYGNFPLKPGEATKDTTNLAELFDLSRPGEYVIHVGRIDPMSKATVKSNTVTVTVIVNDAGE